MLEFTGLPAKAWIFLGLTAFIASLARGFAGFGGALIFIPLASAVIGPRAAAPLLVLIDLVAAAGLMPNGLRHADRREVAFMSGGAAIGIPFGVAVLSVTEPTTIRWATSAAVALLFAIAVSGWHYKGRPSSLLTAGVGGLSGLFSGAAQIGGPPTVIYWLNGLHTARTVRANLVVYFALSAAFSVLVYAIGGLLTPSVLAMAVLIGPAYGLGLYAGARLFGLASEATFRRICYGLIALAVVIGLPVFDRLLR